MATSPQGDEIVYWGCGNGGSISKVESPPQCRSGDDGLSLHVIFPDCWNGRRASTASTTRATWRTPTTGDDDVYRCPNEPPRALPGSPCASRGTFYPDPSTLSLASGSIHSMHADFWNTWNQARLDQLVNPASMPAASARATTWTTSRSRTSCCLT